MTPVVRASLLVAAGTLIAVVWGATASAQDAAAAARAWTYRVRVGAEATATRANTSSPFRGLSTGSLWDGSNRIVAIGKRLVAARLRTAIHGFELALVASGADRRRFSAGANFTHVVGDRLEWHGEWLVHDRTSPWVARLDPACPERCRGAAAGARTMSALIGLQYTSASGVNVVLEGYRDGNGLDDTAWQRLVGGVRAAMAQPPTPASTVATVRPSRRDFVFVRAARASSDARWKPELMMILGVDDGSVTIVPTSGWTLRAHVDVYVRGVALAGARRSEARDAPVRATVMLGLAVRY